MTGWMGVQGNSAPVSGYAFTGVADRGRQMSAYDQLPEAVRRAIDAAPFEMCCVATLKILRKSGEAETLREIEESVRLFLKFADTEWIDKAMCDHI